jgi:hypothetical protein
MRPAATAVTTPEPKVVSRIPSKDCCPLYARSCVLLAHLRHCSVVFQGNEGGHGGLVVDSAARVFWKPHVVQTALLPARLFSAMIGLERKGCGDVSQPAPTQEERDKLSVLDSGGLGSDFARLAPAHGGHAGFAITRFITIRHSFSLLTMRPCVTDPSG